MEEIDFARGLISIQASMMRDHYIRTTSLLRFIKDWQRMGHFKKVLYPYLRDIRWVKEGKPYKSLEEIKVNLIETIIMECVESKEVRIGLQKSFGQFDGAQICENCGRIMYDGYSWSGATYCDEECVLAGENIDRECFNKCLENADDPDGCCYYTDWV